MSNEMITEDGVVIEQMHGLPATIDNAMAGALAKAELDIQIVTARQYPRSVKRALDNILSLATLDEETATECIYALKRGGKPIRGPSIRLAEVIASQWGNCRDTAMVVSIDRVNKLITAEGAFLDLETNRGTKASVQRRISDKYGKLYNDDMIAVTGNAACSIARRNAILAGVPKGVWRRAQEACEQIIRGDASTMVERRDKAIKALAHFNLAPEQIFKLMDVGGLEDIGLDDIATLRVIYTSLKNGEQTVEELMRQIEPDKPARVGPSLAATAAPSAFAASVPTADAKPAPAQAPAQATPSAPTPAHDAETGEITDDDSGEDFMLSSLASGLAAAHNKTRVNEVFRGFERVAKGDADRLARGSALRDQAMQRVTGKQDALM